MDQRGFQFLIILVTVTLSLFQLFDVDEYNLQHINCLICFLT